MHRSGWICVVWLLGAAVLAPAPGRAAEGTATLSGAVVARDGARLPGAAVELEGPAGVLRLASGEAGLFQASGLAPGRYAVRAELAGFAPASHAGVVLAAGESRALVLELDVAPLHEAVTVSGRAPRESLEAQEIRESGARDVGEALSATPGLSVLRKGGIANELVLRGLQSRDLNVLIDGQRVYGACPNHMDPPSFHVDFAEVERVEVGKGPFDLRHQGGAGGTVNVVTRRPEQGVHARGQLALGSWDYWNPALTASLGRSSVSLLGGYSYRQSSPYADGSGRPFTELANYSADHRADDAFRVGTAWGRVAWTPAATHTLQLSYTRQQADDVLYPYLLMDAVYDDTDRLQLRYDAGRVGPVAGLAVQADVSQVEHWMTDAFRTSAGSAPRGYSMGTLATTRTAGGRLEGTLSGTRLGFEGYERRWDATTEMAGMRYAPQRSIPDVSQLSLGAYADTKRLLPGRLELTLAARLDHVRSESDAGPAELALYQAYNATRSTQRDDWLPSAALRLSRKTEGGLTLSAGIGHAPRVPDASERYFALRRMGSDWVGNPELRPARNTTLDATAAWERRGVRLEASLFASRVDDFITLREAARREMVPGVMNPRARSYANVDARLRGGELTAVAALGRRFYLSGDLSYVRGTQQAEPELGILSTDLAEMPPLEGRAALRYDDGRLFAAVEGVFAAGQDHVDTDVSEAATPGYGIANLRAGLRRGRLQLAAGVDNLFDRLFVEHLSYQRDPFRSGVRLPSPGRSAYLNLGLGL